MMVPKVIRTDKDYREALARVEALMDCSPGTREADELDLLSKLVELYEDERWPIEPPSAVDAIRFRMEQAGLRQRDLVPYIGSASKVSEILSGKRSLSLPMIRALHEGLGIPAEALLQNGPARAARGRRRTGGPRRFGAISARGRMARRGRHPRSRRAAGARRHASAGTARS